MGSLKAQKRIYLTELVGLDQNNGKVQEAEVDLRKRTSDLQLGSSL